MATSNPKGSEGIAVFLKDKDGQIICPVTHEDAVFTYDGSISLAETLDDIRTRIPTKTSQLTNDSGFSTGLKISSFVPTKHVILQNTNVNPNASKTGTTTVTKSGYYPMGIVGVNASGIKEYYMSSAASGTANIYYNATNGNPNTITCWLSVWVLWAK